MIKYIGSKRRLVPVLGELLARSGAASALDLFTGTTRVAQEFKRQGAYVVAVDTARYSVQTDGTAVDKDELTEALRYPDSLPGRRGYFTETFCVKARFFQPFNGERSPRLKRPRRQRPRRPTGPYPGHSRGALSTTEPERRSFDMLASASRRQGFQMLDHVVVRGTGMRCSSLVPR